MPERSDTLTHNQTQWAQLAYEAYWFHSANVDVSAANRPKLRHFVTAMILCCIYKVPHQTNELGLPTYGFLLNLAAQVALSSDLDHGNKLAQALAKIVELSRTSTKHGDISDPAYAEAAEVVAQYNR